MYKVIFLDDELITLRMLQSAIDWQKYEVVPSGTATDGEEGVALFQQVEPDIIIADIRMPKMNGIEFARAIRQTKKPVKIILLSAYAEFEYAQSALTYQISDYLLKPLDENKLEGVITRIIQELDSDTTVGSTIQNYRLEHGEKILQRWVIECCENTGMDSSACIPIELRDAFPDVDTLLYLLRVAEPDEIRTHVNSEGIRVFLKDRFGPQSPVVSVSPVELMVLCKERDLRRQIEDVVHGLSLISQPIKVGISRIPESFDLLQAYRQAENALDTTFYTCEAIQFYSDWQHFSSEIEMRLASFEHSLIELVEQGKSNGIIERSQFYLADLFMRHVKPALIGAVMFDFLNWIKIATAKQYPGYPFVEPGAVDRYRLRACSTEEALIAFLTRYLESIGDWVNTILSEEPGYYVVKRSKDYVRDHYTEADLSLQDVADYVGMSKNHFSRVFHETTGTKFWDYVTRLRIEKAKELLKKSNCSNYEICHEIGYNSEFYFSKIFKKVVGVAAQEFRRL